MYYDIVSSDIVNGRIRLLDFFEMGWVGRSSKTVREESSGEKKLHHLLEEVFRWQPFDRLS
jgi:hypothetical protein